MNLTKISSVVFSFLCLSGFLFQVHEVSELYFQFITTSKTELEIREVDHYQTMMYCPRSVDIFNETHKEFGSTKNLILTQDRVENELSNLTIKDILELTPPENSAIKQCVLRQGIMLIPEVMDGRDCESFFNVSKLVIGERICYKIMPKIGANFSVGAVASSKYYTNIVYAIRINRNVLASKFAFFISLTANQRHKNDPLDSRSYQAKVLNERTLNESSFSIYGESTEIHRLPPPFDTKCTPGHRREKCYEKCLNKELALINRLSWSAYHRRKLDIKILTAKDLRNNSISQFVKKAFLQCQSLCKTHKDCYTQFSRTSIQEFHTPYNNHFSSMLPSLPHVSLYAVPFVNLIEYIVQLGSCFGMWFGLSIFSFNPMKCKIILREYSVRRINNRPRRLFILSKIARHE